MGSIKKQTQNIVVEIKKAVYKSCWKVIGLFNSFYTPYLGNKRPACFLSGSELSRI